MTTRISKLSIIEYWPILFARDIPRLSTKQNKKLKAELALLGQQFSWVNFIVGSCSVTMICILAIMLGSNIKLEIWVILQGLTLTISLFILTLNALNYQKNKFTYTSLLIGQLIIAIVGAVAWGTVNYVLSPDEGQLATLAIPLLVAASVVVSIWLSPIPLIALFWQAIASFTFLQLGNIEGDFIYWHALSPIWSTLCMVLCFSLFLSFMRKILSQIELEEIQLINQQLLGQFEQHSSDFIWESDTEGHLIFASRRLLNLGERSDVDDHPLLWDLFTVDQLQQQYLDAKFSSLSAFNSVRVSIGKHTQKQWFSLTGNPTISGSGAPTGFRGFGTDISEAVTLERIKHGANTSRIISQMACTLAHDFNNYLAVVSGSLEMIEATSPLDEAKIDKFCKYGRTAVAQATELSRNLLSIGKNDLLNPTAVDYISVIHSVREELEAVFGADIYVTIDCPTDSFAFADKGQLHRALRNLMENAALSMNGEGTINISSQIIVLGEQAKQQLRKNSVSNIEQLVPGRYCRITITDLGGGFPEEMLDSEIQMFTTTRRKSGGTGIGLAMVNGFCQQSRGALNIYNTSSGAVAELILPAVEAKNSVDEKTNAAIENTSSLLAGKHILIIEDDIELVEVLIENLQFRGLIVESASSLKEANEQLVKLTKIDFIVSDMMLPDGYGSEIYPVAITHFPTMKIVFMTGFVDKTFTDNSEIPGPLLLKPFTSATLIEALIQQ